MRYCWSGGRTLGGIATHYDTLGVDPAAPAERIRAAYRDQARRYHPDRVVVGPDDAMVAVNEAYRVLSDPARRLEYDRSIRLHGSAAAAPPSRQVDHEHVAVAEQPVPSRLIPAGPARVPWKMMAFAAVAGSALILFAAAFNDPPSVEPPDGIIRAGSCVQIETNGDAREVACTNTPDDIVVDLLVPTNATCPAGLAAHRDRLGLGTACIPYDR